MATERETTRETGDHPSGPSSARLASPPLIVSIEDEREAAALSVETGDVLWRRLVEGRLGTVAHGGDLIYLSEQIPVGATRYLDDTTETEWHRRPRIVAYPERITALRASDRAYAWQIEGWRLGHDNPPLALAGDILIADAPASEDEGQGIRAFDARTGAPRWSRFIGLPNHRGAELVAVHGAHVLVCQREENITGAYLDVQRLRVLDAQTGALRWSYEPTDGSPFGLVTDYAGGGAFVVLRPIVGQPQHVEIRRIEDGAVLAERELSCALVALSGAGVALFERSHPQQRLWAERPLDGKVLWRVENIQTSRVVLADDTLYYVYLIQPQMRAEVGALDLATGALRWRWRSPATPIGLLALWGDRGLDVLASAIHKGRANLAAALRANDDSRFHRELFHGQWRHPTRLMGASNTLDVALSSGTLFVATSLGLFAFRAGDGQLRWHALPLEQPTRLFPPPP